MRPTRTSPHATLRPRLLRLSAAAATVALAANTAVLTPLSWGSPAAHGSAAATTTSGSLSVSPGRYVAGQAVHFTGHLGSGGQSLSLQSNMNRPGDVWVSIPGVAGHTDAGGNFDFWHRAPAMYGISYRLVAGGIATPGFRFTTVPQELTLTPAGGDFNYPFYPVKAGQQFTAVVDTAPTVPGTFGTPPAIPGRTVSLQERTAPDSWSTIDSGTTDASGKVSFTVTAPASGTEVLRAREETWDSGISRIGWFPSFPAYFVVSGATSVPEPPTRPATQVQSAGSASRPTASGRYRWGPVRWDYAWEDGKALDSAPSKGNVLDGRWHDTSDGTGRAVPFNGGLVLQSKLRHVGPGDRGTTSAALFGGAQTYGRWEFRLQGRNWETGATPYRFLLELVPAADPAGSSPGCSPESIVLAGTTIGSSGVRFGVQSRSSGLQWQRTLSGLQLANEPFNMAVEVTPKHITWFMNGQPVGTVTDPSAQLGVSLTPRLSLIGAQDVEMNGAQVNSDWERSWTLRTGQQVTSGAALTRSTYAGC